MKESDEQDVVSILEFFQELEDPRSTINRKHLLGEIIVICICSVLANANGPKAMGLWALAKKEWLEQYLELPNGIPSHDTIGRVLALVNPAGFQACFLAWTQRFQAESQESAPDAVKQIAIDGKALRRSHDKRKNMGPLFLVSAWSVECGLSLGQLATDEKSNEITAIPELIDILNVSGAVVTIDAAGCQKNIAKQIVDRGGDYILALKGNQGSAYKTAQQWVHDKLENDFVGTQARKYEVSEKGHGREDNYLYVQFPVPDSFPGKEKWAGLKTIGIAVRHSVKNEKETSDERYFLCSTKLGVKQFSKTARGHWSIENTLHWCLDVSFREDESRLRNRIAAENVAWLKRFAIGILKRVNSKESIIMRRRMSGWNNDYLAQVLGFKRT